MILLSLRQSIINIVVTTERTFSKIKKATKNVLQNVSLN